MQDEEDMILSAQRKDKGRPAFFWFIWSSVIESPVYLNQAGPFKGYPYKNHCSDM